LGEYGAREFGGKERREMTEREKQLEGQDGEKAMACRERRNNGRSPPRSKLLREDRYKLQDITPSSR